MIVRGVSVGGLAMTAWCVAACAPGDPRDDEIWSLNHGNATRALTEALNDGDFDRLERFAEKNPLAAFDRERGVMLIANGRSVMTISSGTTTWQVDFPVGRLLALPAKETSRSFLIGSADGLQFTSQRYEYAGDQLLRQMLGEPSPEKIIAEWGDKPWWPSPWSPYEDPVVPLDEDLVERFIQNVTDHRGIGVGYRWIVGEIADEVRDPFERRVAARHVLAAASDRSALVHFDGVSRIALKNAMRAEGTDNVIVSDLSAATWSSAWTAERGEVISDVWFDEDTLVIKCERHVQGARQVTLPWLAGEFPRVSDAESAWR